MPSTLYERAKKKSIWKNIDEAENMKKSTWKWEIKTWIMKTIQQ